MLFVCCSTTLSGLLHGAPGRSGSWRPWRDSPRRVVARRSSPYCRTLGMIYTIDNDDYEMLLVMRISSSPRQRQSTASVSVAGLLGLALQETWSKRSEAERLPLLFLISCVRSSSMQNDQINLRKPDRARRSGWRWEHQSWREQSVEQAGVELRRWGRRSTVRSSPRRSTWLENTLRSELQIKISNCFIRVLTFHIRHKKIKS